MNAQANPTRFVPVMETSEGAGVTVHRAIGIPALRNLDPFILLDHISSNNPDDVIAPIVDSITHVSYFDVQVKAGKHF